MTSDSEVVRAALGKMVESATSRGMPAIALRGQLIRPALAYAASSRDSTLSPEFWSGALAIQYAHEASLVHDDIVDEAKTRRGEATVVSARGVGQALVIGDHLLTASYRLASDTKSLAFVSLFANCVEQTVAGEIAQARSIGNKLSFDQYRSIAKSKSGELLAASLALGASLEDSARIEPRAALGRELGLLYQMLDDLLDYCPATDTGKAVLGDFKQKRWTWPLLELGEFSFDESSEDVSRRFRNRQASESALERCVARIEHEAHSLRSDLTAEFGGADVGQSLIDEWVGRAREAVCCETGKATVPSTSLRSRLPPTTDVVSYLADNSKSFRFASRLFPRRELDSVAHVYAFCRVTDDLVDKSEPLRAAELLEEWMTLARSAYYGDTTGIAFLDRVMTEMSSAQIPFSYASDLAEGMRMDLRGDTYATMSDLRTYTYRVASVVGLWLTELAGVRDTRTLRHAEALGHAMQLTNILRDVGEDARHGRVYIPTSRLETYGLSRAIILSGSASASLLPRGFPDLIEEMMRIAERDYSFALEGVRLLPSSFQKPVAVAAHVYRGIHSGIRRNKYDTLTRRAVTSTRTKAMLAARAIWHLQTAQSPVLRTA